MKTEIQIRLKITELEEHEKCLRPKSKHLVKNKINLLKWVLDEYILK